MIKRLSARLWPAPARSLQLLLCALPLTLLTGYVLIARPNLSHLAAYGYAGVFGLMALSNATILLPMPGMATVATAGLMWNPLLVGLAGGLGGALGEIVGYAAGYGAHELIDEQRQRWLRRFKEAVQRYGFIAIVLLAAIPNPLFDVVGLAAGSLAYPAWRFYVAVAIGNTVKCTAVALLGGALGQWFPWTPVD